MNSDTIIRFLLKGGHFLEVVMKLAEAQRIQRDWIDEVILGKTGKTGGTYHFEGQDRLWAVDLSQVQALFTYAVPPAGVMAGAFPVGKFLAGTSGMR